MRQETAELVAQIGRTVKSKWPNCAKDERFKVLRHILSYSGEDVRTINHTNEALTVEMQWYETIYLTIDGDLGVYYTHEDDKREPIRIQLLPRRKVIVTKVYEVEVPCFEDTLTSDLLVMAKDYDHKFQYSNIEENRDD